MVARSPVVTSRLSLAFALVMLGAVTFLQAISSPPAGAASLTAVLAWGDNSTGQLGNGITGGTSDTPVAVSLPSGVTPIAIAGGGGSGSLDPEAAMYATYAIGSDGHVYAWGDNSNGALGDGSTVANSPSPVVVSLPSGVTATAISAAQGTGYAIGSDGNLYAWGDNDFGKLGIGPSTATNSLSPVVVSLPTGVTPTAIAGGYESAYAIGSDGHMYAWGDNSLGELGNGGTTNSTTPVVVSLPSGVTPKAIAGGGGTGYAIGSDSMLYAWGYNPNGQLGNASTTNSSTPVVVGLPSGVTPKAITGGGGFAHAIGSDGNLYGWGLGANGQLGVGTSDSSVPIEVSLAAGVKPTAITDSLHTGYAIGTDGNLYAWGYGLSGELGNGGTSSDSPPVIVSLPSASTPEALGAEPGAISGYAIVSEVETAPSITTSPASQTVFAGASVSFSAAASGVPAPTVQWQFSTNGGSTWSNVSGATSTTYSISSVPTSDNGWEFRAVFTNVVSTATTNAATLTVTPPVAPTVTTQPTDQTATPGQITSFTSTANGMPAPSVVWQVSRDGGTSWSDIQGNSTSTSTTLSGVVYGTFENGWEVRAVFTNTGGTATSNPATLTVTPPVAPTVTTQPTDQTATPGQITSFTSTANGMPAPSVVWQVSRDGGTSWSDIQGNSTSTSTTLSGVVYGTFENGWEVRAVFTNTGGTATSNPATLIVT